MKITERARKKLASFGLKEFKIAKNEKGSYEIVFGEKGEKSVRVGEFIVYFDEKLEELSQATLDFDCFFSIRFENESNVNRKL